MLDQPELVIQSETEAVEDKFENLVDQAEQKITEGKSIVFKWGTRIVQILLVWSSIILRLTILKHFLINTSEFVSL